jgi:hypothetical protein
MIMHTSALALVLCAISLLSATGIRAKSPPNETPRAQTLQAARAELATPKSMPSSGDVGDADSFGHSVIYIGLTQTGAVTFAADCTPAPGDPPAGPDDRCFVVPAPPAAPTHYDVRDIARVGLPSHATRSLVCFEITGFAFWEFANPTAAATEAAFSYNAYFTIDNAALADPTLINPLSGTPFNGRLELPSFGGPLFREVRTIVAGSSEFHELTASRGCVDGMVSRRALRDTYHLPNAVIDQFFHNAMTIHSNLRGVAEAVDSAQVVLGTRFYGD